MSAPSLPFPVLFTRGPSLFSLFANGEQGFLFPNFQLSPGYIFQDSVGTTPVVADSDPVGRANDQSGRGNNAVNATSGQRPLWRSNSGKPYLSFDGSDDRLVTTFVPRPAGTMAVAFNAATLGVTQGLTGGGATATNARAYLVINGGNSLAANIGNTTITAGAATGSDRVALVTWDASSADLYLDGVLGATAVPATLPDATGGGLAIGCINPNGSPTNFLNGREYAALAVSRRVTSAEIARITSIFRSTFQ